MTTFLSFFFDCQKAFDTSPSKKVGKIARFLGKHKKGVGLAPSLDPELPKGCVMLGHSEGVLCPPISNECCYNGSRSSFPRSGRMHRTPVAR